MFKLILKETEIDNKVIVVFFSMTIIIIIT